MNKLAVLAFALLMFFSTMLWYLANGSLNDYLKSQVLLQANYYSGQAAQLAKAEFSSDSGVSQFDGFSLANIEGAKQPHVLLVDEMTAQLAPVAISQLNSPSVSKKTTTIVHIENLTLSHLQAWTETAPNENSNLTILLNKISLKLAEDYPALYPEISAKQYAKVHPEQNEQLALDNHVQTTETNQAVIESKAAKKKQRLLGKAQIRVIISAITIEKLTLTNSDNNSKKELEQIVLDGFGGEEGLDSNQVGGELLRALLEQLKRMAE